jgi:hypothetical protein
MGAQPAGEHSESPRYASCHPEITFFELNNEDRSDKSRKETIIFTHQEDNGRQSLEQALLDRGSTPPRIDEDYPAVAAMAVAEVGGTYKILKEWASSFNARIMPIPFFVVRSY